MVLCLKNEKRSGIVAYSCFVVAVLAMRFSWFENLADLKFFHGVGLPFDLWSRAFPVADGYVVAPCSEMEEMLRVGSRIPVLFKGCIAEDLGPSDFVYFSEGRNNIFPQCEEKVVRSFEFESIDGGRQDIKEDVPCADDSTLQSKVDSWVSHDPVSEGPTHDVHVYHMDRDEKRHVLKDWNKKNITTIDSKFLDDKAAAMTYFFHAGRTAVYYHHSHMDHVLSFNLQATKTWELINPKYHDNFDYTWSGSALVLLKEKKAAPRVFVKQEKGDILFMPSWWIHKTKVQTHDKNFGFNVHMMRSDQASGVGLRVAAYFGITDWFYRNA